MLLQPLVGGVGYGRALPTTDAHRPRAELREEDTPFPDTPEGDNYKGCRARCP